MSNELPTAMAHFILRGFTTELEGNEADILFAPPVVSSDGEDLVIGRTNAGEVELRRLADRDREYVRWFQDPAVREIGHDEGVWIVGPTVVRSLAGVGTEALASQFKGWASLGEGFRWTTGTYRDYIDFMQSCANSLESTLHRALFVEWRKKRFGATRIFNLYQAFAIQDTLERALNSALYYSEAHETRSLDLEIADAVSVGHSRDAREFRSKLQNLRALVLSARLSEELDHARSAKPPRRKEAEPGSTTRGTVKWFNAEKGFGFVTPSDGSPDVVAYYSAIVSSGYMSLRAGQIVEIELGVESAEVVRVDPKRPRRL